MTSFMLILSVLLRRRPSLFQRTLSMSLQMRKMRRNVVIRLIIRVRSVSPQSIFAFFFSLQSNRVVNSLRCYDYPKRDRLLCTSALTSEGII